MFNSTLLHINSHKTLYKSFNFSYKSQKYKLDDILSEIIYVSRTGISWRMIKSDIHWNTIYKIFVKLKSYNIFKLTYIDLLKKYTKKNKNKLKYVYTDTSIISNKYGIDKVKRNKYCKNKKVSKLSIVTLSNGIPFNVKLYNGNRNDAFIFMDHVEDNLINIDKKNIKIFMADKGYDSIKIKNYLTKNNINYLIPQNKRNTKNNSKIINMTPKDKIKYKKRIKVENMFQKIKSFRRLNIRYDKYSENYMSFLWLGLSHIIMNV
jgi:transposase